MNVQQKIEQARALADAIEQAVRAVDDDQARANAEKMVWKIRAESESESPKPGRFKALATTAMTSIGFEQGSNGKTISAAILTTPDGYTHLFIAVGDWSGAALKTLAQFGFKVVAPKEYNE